MLKREEIIEIINNIAKDTPNDREIYESYISKVESIPDNELEEFIKNNNVTNAEDIRRIINDNINKRADRKFGRLNDIVGYGVNGNTLHIHVMPEELKDALSKVGRKKLSLELIDALEKIQELIKGDIKYKDVKSIYAVSGILRGPLLDMFENLEFDTRCVKIKDAKEDEELSKFYEIFKDKKYLGRAQLSTDSLLSDEWNENKDTIKENLRKELGIKQQDEDVIDKKGSTMLQDDLKKMVNDEETIIKNYNTHVKEKHTPSKNVEQEKSIANFTL